MLGNGFGYGTNLCGYRYISSPHMADKVPIRRHRKKRFHKKWLKRYGYRYLPWENVLIAGDVIYAHPVTLRKLQAKLARGGDCAL